MTDEIAVAVQHIVVEAEFAGQRIDNFLMRVVGSVPRPLIYRILRRGEVRVNRGRVRQGYRLEAGDVVRIPPMRLAPERLQPAPTTRLRDVLESSVLLEDSHWLVINKPAGLAVHGGSGQSLGVIEAMRQLRPDLRYLELVHRLDRDTSGCLLLATRRSALRAAHAALRERDAHKQYLALVAGQWPKRRRRIDAPLLRNVLRSGERIVQVDESAGKAAATDFEVLERGDDCSLVRAHPITGRTHQIRVHALSAGHAIAGDPKYGDEKFNAFMSKRGLRRLFLHAERLRIDALELDVQAPLEPSLAEVIVGLGFSVPRARR
jgi:23S rRNA pseudouridine955/2504/2580 synthase